MQLFLSTNDNASSILYLLKDLFALLENYSYISKKLKKCQSTL